MFKAWLFGVGILFVLAEFSIWLKQFMLPLPIYILGGAFLAIASNYEKGLIALFRQRAKFLTDEIMPSNPFRSLKRSLKKHQLKYKLATAR